MNRLMTWVAAAVVVVAASGAYAGEFKPAQVPAEAKFVAHLDVSGLLKSGLGQFLLGKVREAQPGLDDKMAEMAEKLGFNPLTDLEGITIFGTEFSPNAAVILVQGVKYDKAKLLRIVLANPECKTVEYGAHSLYQWKQTPEDKQDTGVRVGVFYNETAVLVSRSDKALQRAIDVLDGKAKGLAKDAALLGELPKGTFLLAAAEGFKAPETAEPAVDGRFPQAAFLKLVTGGKLVLGQSDQTVFASLAVTASNEDDAARLRQMAQGALAMVQLVKEYGGKDIEAAPAELLAIVQAAKIGGAGATARVDLSVALDNLKSLLEKIQKADAAKKAAPKAP